MFERMHPGTGQRYSQLHATASALSATVNHGSYAALLGFAQGNLAEVSSYAQAAPRQAPKMKPRTTFNALLKFEPPPGECPSFYMTAASPTLSVLPRLTCNPASASCLPCGCC